MPFPINALSQAVGTMFLEEFPASLRAAMTETVQERKRVFAALTSIQAAAGKVFEVMPSEGNFHLVHSPMAAELCAELRKQGVAVRTFSAPHAHHPLAGVLRISVGTPDQNDRMLAALQAALGQA